MDEFNAKLLKKYEEKRPLRRVNQWLDLRADQDRWLKLAAKTAMKKQHLRQCATEEVGSEVTGSVVDGSQSAQNAPEPAARWPPRPAWAKLDMSLIDPPTPDGESSWTQRSMRNQLYAAKLTRVVHQHVLNRHVF